MRISVRRLLFSLAVAALGAHATSSGAYADLVIDIKGTNGGSATIWTFSGSSTAVDDGTIRIEDTFGISAGDTWEIGNDPINDSISDTLYSVLSGSASVTVGGDTQTITQIFLDSDPNGNDDFGIRVDSQLDYLMSEASSWTGSVVLPIAVSDLRLGSFTLASVANPGPNFASGPGAIDINIVPEPSSLAMLGLAGFFGGAFRFRRRKNGSAGEPALS